MECVGAKHLPTERTKGAGDIITDASPLQD